MKQIYVIDTSAFSSWWSRSYPIDVFPSLWEYLSTLIAEGRLLSSIVVKEELNQGADEGLQAWVKDNQVNGFFEIHGPSVQSTATRLSENFPLLRDQTRLDADPWVVAQAYSLCVPKRVVAGVLSNETRVDKASKKVKIPNLCDFLEIRHFDLVQFARSENLRL